MKLKTLNVRRMPGFEEKGFKLENLSEGLNLIVGPNASGKTTSCRAIRGLLWPETLKGSVPVSLVGLWQENENTFRIELEGDHRTCQADGQTSESPEVPGQHLAECFTVTVGSLIQATDNDANLAGIVLREMAGGYVLEDVLKEFSLSSRHGRADLRARNEAQQQVRQITQEQQALQKEESELGGLEQKERESRQALTQLERLKDVLQLLDIRSQIVETDKLLEDLPPDMNLLNGEDKRRLEQIQDDLELESKNREEAEKNAKEAQRQKDGAKLPPEGVPQNARSEQKAKLEELRETEQQIRQRSDEVAQVKTQVSQALGRLGEEADAEKLNEIDLNGLDTVEASHHNVEQLLARKTAIEERLKVLGKEQPLGETNSLADAIGILRQWFEATAEISSTPDFGRNMAWTLSALFVVAGVVLGFFVNLWALFLVGLGVVATFLLLAFRVPATQGGRQVCQQRYGRLGIESPKRWDVETVGKHVNDLEQRLAEARSLEQLQSERNHRQAELDQLKPNIQKAELRHRVVVERLGVASSTSDLSLVTFSRDLLNYREARDKLLGLEEMRRQIETRENEQLDGVNEYLKRFGQEVCDGYQTASARSEDIAKRAEDFRQAGQSLDQAQREITSVQSRIDELSNRKRDFFESRKLSEGDESGLGERLRQLDRYNELKDRLSDLRSKQTASLDRLSDTPDLQDWDRKQVDEETSRLKILAEKHKGLLDKIAAIRAEVDRARRERTLQNAQADLDQATNTLVQCRQEAKLASAGAFLMGLVQDEQQTKYQPAVLRQAREWLNDFTRGRYELRMGTTFYAYDTTQQRGLELEELSGGTRMQLLLAVRLAFAANAERGVQLPFVLDEALSGTDPTRFRAVIECLTAIIRQGRQVFYLTCQPGDAKAWREVTGDQGFYEAKLIDLARVRDLQQSTGTLLEASAVTGESLPAPEGRTLSEYASSLGVPAFDPAAGASGLHVAFLLDDPEHLHGLLHVGIKSYGQLKSLLSHGSADAYLPSEAAQKMGARAIVAQAVCDAWKEGRGRSINREVLSAAGVSATFLDRVTELAQDLNWDARRLVEALEDRKDERANGFRANTLETVKEYLSDNGYLDLRPQLTEEDALIRVLFAAHDPVHTGVIDVGEVRDLFRRFWSQAVDDESTSN